MIIIDKIALKDWATAIVIHGLTALGKYVVPVLVGKLGIDQAAAGNWWTATAQMAGAAIVAGGCSAIDRWYHAKV